MNFLPSKSLTLYIIKNNYVRICMYVCMYICTGPLERNIACTDMCSIWVERISCILDCTNLCAFIFYAQKVATSKHRAHGCLNMCNQLLFIRLSHMLTSVNAILSLNGSMYSWCTWNTFRFILSVTTIVIIFHGKQYYSRHECKLNTITKQLNKILYNVMK